jgi:Kef-type K+ transport system membrane component KefB
MELDLSRLRRGEWIAAGSALALLAVMFLLKWYGVPGVSVNAWHALSILRWLMLLTIVTALVLAYLQASRRSPALPVTFSVLLTTVAVLLVLLLIYRVLINEPGPDDIVGQRLGAYLGLLCALGITYGGYRSMRAEGLSPRDAGTQIETLATGHGRSGHGAPPDPS